MKKVVFFLIFVIVAMTLFGCGDTDMITIYTLNDFHGAIFEGEKEVGISKLGRFLMDEKKASPHSTLIISAGDMFQGTAVSSLTRGEAIVDAMNAIGFDAMTIGNHEFDWGIYGISRWNDANKENGEADFPLLGANIYHKETAMPVSWAKPYTILNRGGLRIGIIGTIGENLTEDILASIVKDYEFINQFDTIKKYAKLLRTEENCDIVIASCHYNTEAINMALADLTGDYAIDAVINGHTHQEEYGIVIGNKGVPLPYVQSRDSGVYIGKITLQLDPETKQVVDAWSTTLPAKEVATKESSEINEILAKYQNEIDAANEKLAIAAKTVSRTDGAIWAANMIRNYQNTDIGFVNWGGIRGTAFPIAQSSQVTYDNIFRIMPFENTIVICKLTGQEIIDLFSENSDLYYSRNYNPGTQTINGEPIEFDQYYTAATVDFVFERIPLFLDAVDVVYTNDLFREHLVSQVKKSAQTNQGIWKLYD